MEQTAEFVDVSSVSGETAEKVVVGLTLRQAEDQLVRALQISRVFTQFPRVTDQILKSKIPNKRINKATNPRCALADTSAAF